MKYKILQVGASGSGKTWSNINLGKNTAFINVENKPLPFKDNFKSHSIPKDYTEALKALIEAAKNPDIDIIVFDSFSAYMESVLKEARASRKGFDVWNFYNEEIAKFHTILNRIDKTVFVTGHYEILNIEGNAEKRLKVQGRENEGLVERHYTIVMYSDKKWNEDRKRFDYFFTLAGENLSAKCPPQIFGEDVINIPNDNKFINEKIEEFINN